MISVWWLLRSLFLHTGEDESVVYDLVNRGTIMILIRFSNSLIITGIF